MWLLGPRRTPLLRFSETFHFSVKQVARSTALAQSGRLPRITGVALEVRDRLSEMMDFGHKKTAAGYPEAVGMVPMVAGTGFEPVTFRL